MRRRPACVATADPKRAVQDNGMEGYAGPSNMNSEWEWRKRRRKQLTLAVVVTVGLVGLITWRKGRASWNARAAGTDIPDKYKKDSDLFPNLEMSDEQAAKWLPKELFLDHIRVLADDKDMAGRGVGTPGEEAAVSYIETVYKQMKPDGVIRRQRVPLAGATTDLNETRLSFDEGKHKWISPDDWWATVVGKEDGIVEIDRNNVSVVFGGYCTPQFGQWTIRPIQGAVVVCLVGEPDSLRLKNGLQTYYTRWVYKLEEMARQKARGVLLIHTTSSVGYPWQVIHSAAKVENVRIAEPAQGPNRLEFWGWLNGVSWEKMRPTGAPGLDELFAEAENPEFTPRQTTWQFAAWIEVQTRKFVGQNVIVDFFPIEHSSESIVIMARHDHLGVGSDNKTVYPGALDNASGVSKVMILARALNQLIADSWNLRALHYELRTGSGARNARRVAAFWDIVERNLAD